MNWAIMCSCVHCASQLLHCKSRGLGLPGRTHYIAACGSTCQLLSGLGSPPPPPLPKLLPHKVPVPVNAGSSSFERTAGGCPAAACRCVHAAAEGARCPAASSPAGACCSEGHLPILLPSCILPASMYLLLWILDTDGEGAMSDRLAVCLRVTPLAACVLSRQSHSASVSRGRGKISTKRCFHFKTCSRP